MHVHDHGRQAAIPRQVQVEFERPVPGHLAVHDVRVAYHSAQGYSAGDILTTGTISGVAAVQPNPFEFYLQPGDNIEAEIEGVGLLRNHVVPWGAVYDTPPYSTDLYSSTE